MPANTPTITRCARAAVFLCATALALPALAERARLTIEIDAEGTEQVVGNGSDNTTGKFQERVQVVTYLEASGEPMDVNPKDPHYAQQMMGRAAAVQQKAQQMSGNKTSKMTPQQMQAYLEKKKAACGADQSCLMALAMEASQLSANLDYGAPAADTASAGDDGEMRYQMYVGYDNCGASTHVRVNSDTQGTFGDVSGAVPYSVQYRADYHADANEQQLICTQYNLIVDTKSNTLFSDGFIVPRVVGSRSETQRGKTTTSNGDIPLHGDVMTWVSEQLRKAPLSGERSTQLNLTLNQSKAIHAGQYSGKATVRISWRFERVSN